MGANITYFISLLLVVKLFKSYLLYREIQRKREEDLSMELIKSMQSEQMAIQDKWYSSIFIFLIYQLMPNFLNSDQETAENQALINMLEAEDKKESDARFFILIIIILYYLLILSVF